MLLAVLALSTSAADSSGGDSSGWKAPDRAARKKNPLTPNAENLAVGKDIYVQECSPCHGNSGRGDGPSAKDLDPKPRDFTATSVVTQTDGALFWKIGEGHKPMPGFERSVSDDGRWHVVNYLRTLAPATRPSTQATTQPATQP